MRQALWTIRNRVPAGPGCDGCVYKAIDPKTIDLWLSRRFIWSAMFSKKNGSIANDFFQEAQAAGRLLHPGIVTIFDVGEDPEDSFVATRFPAKFLRHSGAMQLVQAARIENRSQYLGHKSIASTGAYLRANDGSNECCGAGKSVGLIR